MWMLLVMTINPGPEHEPTCHLSHRMSSLLQQSLEPNVDSRPDSYQGYFIEPTNAWVLP